MPWEAGLEGVSSQPGLHLRGPVRCLGSGLPGPPCEWNTVTRGWNRSSCGLTDPASPWEWGPHGRRGQGECPGTGSGAVAGGGVHGARQGLRVPRGLRWAGGGEGGCRDGLDVSLLWETPEWESGPELGTGCPLLAARPGFCTKPPANRVVGSGLDAPPWSEAGYVRSLAKKRPEGR